MFTVNKDVVRSFILDDTRTWQMSWRPEIALLIFCAVLLSPEKLELFRCVTVNRNLSLMQSWSKKMSSLERALLKINFGLVRISKTGH